MRETHLQDLVDFSYFIKATNESNLFNSNLSHRLDSGFGTRLNILKNRINIISKVSKSVNMKYYDIRDEF